MQSSPTKKRTHSLLPIDEKIEILPEKMKEFANSSKLKKVPKK